MLDYIKTRLQTILSAIGTANTTLRTVAVIQERSNEPAYAEYTDQQTLYVIYRTNPGMRPQLPVQDRIESGTFDVVAVESEINNVLSILNDFIAENNATYVPSIDMFLQFTDIVSGETQYFSARKFAHWTFGILARTIGDVSDLTLRAVLLNDENVFSKTWVASNSTYYNAQANTNKATSAVTGESAPVLPIENASSYAVGFAMRTTRITETTPFFVYEYYVCGITHIAMDYTKGLFDYSLTVRNEYAQHPISGGYNLVKRATTAVLSIVLIDNSASTESDTFKALGYDNDTEYHYIKAVSGDHSMTIYGKITDFNDKANAQGFPALSIIFEGRVI